MKKVTAGDRAFNIINGIFLVGIALLCILPFIHIFSLSLSSTTAVNAGKVSLWPVDFTTGPYRYVLSKDAFIVALGVSVKRVLLGVTINIALAVLTAYPLSKDKRIFRGRTVIAWYFVVTMLFSGGLVPTYLMVSYTGIMNSLWALILPGAVNVFNLTILNNFFRGIPKELEESAFMDGAGHLRILWSIYLPLSMACLATLIVFQTVGHWNEWFSALLYMNKPSSYPLQTYLQNIVTNVDLTLIDENTIRQMGEMSDRTYRAAQIILAALPIIVVYPFMQRYFVKGMVMGSIKG